ncbi:Uncharacterised protein [Pseudomonas aeruginosa]|nr:Uncharacterised protein [Pseudomonas aeruginosa]
MAFAGVAAEVAAMAAALAAAMTAAMTATVAAAIAALGISGADRRKLARQQGAAREQQAESGYGEQGMFFHLRDASAGMWCAV